MPNRSSDNFPVRKCNCSGGCGPRSDYTLSRREFLSLVGVGSAAALVGTPGWAAFELPPDQYDRWRRSLFAPAEPRRYLSDKHTDARMHLGGIGTGNFEIGADGQFTTWQLFNTLRDGYVPFYFLVKAGASPKLLQTASGPDWPRVKQIEMAGEYPFATLRFRDADLPVELELSAFSPFAPLDAHFSSMPLAAFVFRVHNPAKRAQTVSLAALMQNPVGYEADGENTSATHPNFGGNVNQPLREGKATGLLLRALPGREPALDRPVTVLTLSNLKGLNAPPLDRPANLKVDIIESEPLPSSRVSEAAQTVIWLEQPSANISVPFLQSLREAVRRGATLLLSGSSTPLLQAYASWTGGKPSAAASSRPDIVFEDFEHGYDGWKVEGEAFGKAPATGTLPNQQRVSGFLGHGLVNTYLDGDGTTGRLVSKTFRIERRFVRFLVGGGNHNQTQIRLIVDGKVVHATSGKDNERLEPAVWDVAALEGQMAHIEIVDDQQGGWGHINVDQIEFSDLPGQRELMVLLEELLPARIQTPNSRALQPKNLTLLPGATQSKSTAGLDLISRPLGGGKVVIALGAVLEPGQAGIVNSRQSAFATLCALVGANYSGLQGPHPKAPGFGTLALVTLGRNASILPAVEEPRQAWDSFAAKGGFTAPGKAQPNAPTPTGHTLYGAVASTVRVPPGGTVDVPFLLAWHYPNKYSTSNQVPEGTWMGCHYATQWTDAAAVIREAAAQFTKLANQTELFRRTFYDSTLPYWLLDCVTANMAILRHIGVVFRIANGDVYGWEGSNGCCDPTCTHVWGYEQTLARLFPALERQMRRIDFTHQQRPDGGVNNRTAVPSPPRPTGEQPFADGHASCILKAYREALNCRDDGFFREYWPHIKRAVEYLIDRDAKSAGGQPIGILQDDQWNTYDEALHGVTSFISGYYLAALRAGEAWARRLGDATAGDRFREVFERGQKKLIELCWNGEYFQQHLPDYLNRQGEVGPGCMADQFIGQWWAHQLGLGYILPKGMVVAGLRSVFKYNFKSDLTGWRHAPRAFAGAKDKGLIICTWPKGGRPANVMLYSDEVWTGIEYQVAAHMIYEGLVEEGFAVVKAARDRYDGIPRPPIQRNPWNEIECGGHYARAMSSWSLLLALSGWEYDGPAQRLRFAPRHTPGDFRSFFVGPEGWGSVSQSRHDREQRNEISVKEGQLRLSEIILAVPDSTGAVQVHWGGESVTSSSIFGSGVLRISLKDPVAVTPARTLAIQISAGRNL